MLKSKQFNNNIITNLWIFGRDGKKPVLWNISGSASGGAYTLLDGSTNDLLEASNISATSFETVDGIWPFLWVLDRRWKITGNLCCIVRSVSNHWLWNKGMFLSSTSWNCRIDSAVTPCTNEHAGPLRDKSLMNDATASGAEQPPSSLKNSASEVLPNRSRPFNRAENSSGDTFPDAYCRRSFLVSASSTYTRSLCLDPVISGGPSVSADSSCSLSNKSFLQPNMVPSHTIMLGSVPHVGHSKLVFHSTSMSRAKQFHASLSLLKGMHLVLLRNACELEYALHEKGKKANKYM